MAGHSKWANIKHKKAAVDAKRGKIFSKIAREITVCARQGGGDPTQNISLRTLVSKARGVNMPADNIDRAIKKGTGELKEDIILEEITYEGFAAGGNGVTVLVHVCTDNKNRSASEVRLAFTKSGANLAAQGAVSRSYTRTGLITVKADTVEEETLMDLVLENGAEDMQRDDDMWSITVPPKEYPDVLQALETAEITHENAEVTMLPESYIDIVTTKNAQSIMKFIDKLEDLDDVEDVYTNANFTDEVLAELEAEG